MAVTVTASKIDITSGTETLETVYDAVAASAFSGLMTDDGGGTTGWKYTITNAELEISNGATLNITDASYEDGYLHWAITANRAPGLDLQNGGTLTCTAPGFTFNLDTSNGNYNYWYIAGNITLTGTQAKPIVITRYYRTRFFAYPSNNAVSFDYVSFTDASSYSTGGTPLWFDYGYGKPSYSFTNISVTDDGTSSYLMLADSGLDLTDVTFDNWDTTLTRYGFYTLGQNLKISNSTINQVNREVLYQGGNNGGTFYHNQYTEVHQTTLQQPKMTFDTCTFSDNYTLSSSEHGLSVGEYTVVKYKNCTFQGENAGNPLVYGIYGLYCSRHLLQGGIAGQTFTDVTNKFYFNSVQASGYYEVYELDLTVNGTGGTPLENATVVVRQKEGHELHHFKTDSNGQIHDCFGDDPVFVYREILTNTPTYDTWSDGTGNQTHIITISHADYQVDTREVAFSSNQSITAQLTANDTGVTTIYGSTIFGSTIY